MRLLQNSAVYSGLGFLEKGIGILLLPIYTRYLTPADYGIVSVVDSLIAFLVMIYPLGADATLIRTQYTEKDPARLAKLRGTLLTFLILVGLFGTVLFSLGKSFLIEPFAGNISFWPFLALGLVSAWFQPIQRAYLTILQARQDAMGYLYQAGGSSILRVGLVLLFVVVFGWGAVGLLSAIILPYIIFSLLSLWNLRKEVTWGVDRAALHGSLKYSMPVVPHLLAGWTTAYLGTIVLNYYEGTSDVGLYSLAARFALIVSFVIGGVSQALQPQMYEYLSAPTEKSRSIAQLKVLGVLSVFAIVSVGTSLFSGDLVRLLATPAFHQASGLIPLLALAAFIQGAYIFYANALYFEEHGPRFLPIASISGALISIALMFWLIPDWGAYGAAIATLAGVTVRMVTAAALGNRKAGIYWGQLRFTAICLATAALCGAAWFMVIAETALWIRVLLFLPCLLLPFLSSPFPILRAVSLANWKRISQSWR